MSLLDQIIQQKKTELPALRGRSWTPLAGRPVPALRVQGRLQLIAEIKMQSPSAGALNQTLSVSERARVYETAGADMISVLCDERFFAGSYENLRRAREGSTLPLLAKEFIIDPIQLEVAAHHGASLALLIVRCLEKNQLKDLIQAARALHLEPLVEVFTEEETEAALQAGATSIGVNARDLDTLQMNPKRAARVVELLPQDVVRYYFSGVKEPDDVSEIRATGADGALIGEVLMRLDDPQLHLRKLRQAAGS